MKFRNVGTSGLRVSEIGLGCNNFGARIDLEHSEKVVNRAIEQGVTFFDTADVYGGGASEDHLGQILGSRRQNIVLASKFGRSRGERPDMKGGSHRYIMLAVEGSLKRLRTDYLDLYQIHFPDDATPIDETLRALHDLVSQGKVRYIGCSNFEPWRTVEALACSRELKVERFVSCQNQFSLLAREEAKALFPVLHRYGLGLLPYYPLAGGFLTGKYSRGAPMPEGSRLSYVERLSKRYVTDTNYDLIEKLGGFSEARGRSLLDLAFAWLLAHSEVASIIAGATRPEQVDMNVRAGEWRLNHAEMAEIEKILAAGRA